MENDTLHWGEEEDSVDLRPWWFDWGRTGPEEETAPPSSVGMEAGEEELEFRQFSLEYPSARWNGTDSIGLTAGRYRRLGIWSLSSLHSQHQHQK